MSRGDLSLGRWVTRSGSGLEEFVSTLFCICKMLLFFCPASLSPSPTPILPPRKLQARSTWKSKGIQYNAGGFVLSSSSLVSGIFHTKCLQAGGDKDWEKPFCRAGHPSGSEKMPQSSEQARKAAVSECGLPTDPKSGWKKLGYPRKGAPSSLQHHPEPWISSHPFACTSLTPSLPPSFRSCWEFKLKGTIWSFSIPHFGPQPLDHPSIPGLLIPVLLPLNFDRSRSFHPSTHTKN